MERVRVDFIHLHSAHVFWGLSLLKVPKCEIFDSSDFPDFYTIKSRPEGGFGVKIKNL